MVRTEEETMAFPDRIERTVRLASPPREVWPALTTVIRWVDRSKNGERTGMWQALSSLHRTGRYEIRRGLLVTKGAVP